MEKKSLFTDGIILFIPIAICVAIIYSVFFQNDWVAKANDGKDIVPYTREAGSGTRTAFNKITKLEKNNWLGELEDTTSERIAEADSSKEMIEQVSHTRNGLGYVSYAVKYDDADVKTLKVEGVEPTIDNIKNESYPLLRDFNLVYCGKMSGLEEDFLHYIKSEGQGYISDYCVPARDKGIFLPHGAEGTLTISGSTSMTPMMEVLVEKYMEVNPKAKVIVKESDSESGMVDVIAGNSNFGMVSRTLKSYEKSIFSSERIGRDAIVIIINQKNENSDVSIEQLRRIYNGSIKSWRYLKVGVEEN